MIDSDFISSSIAVVSNNGVPQRNIREQAIDGPMPFRLQLMPQVGGRDGYCLAFRFASSRRDPQFFKSGGDA
ncbi:hypothetical protein GFL88_00965 [Rhizobium leguminosarum bv. viciae]|nr:hypothetical protein [Rhizobium leguminosarum bv. viciae]